MTKDPYVYPGTVVLINKLDVHDAVSLQEIENSFYFAQLTKPLPIGGFDYKHLKNIHKHLFGNLYSWAGEERTVDIIKANSHFARKEFITNEINKQFASLKTENYLQNVSIEIFIGRAAHYFNEINAAHPFREGNGRTLRAFFGLLAEQAGYQLSWDKVDSHEYTRASILGFNENNKPMEEVFKKVTLPLEQELSLHNQNASTVKYAGKELKFPSPAHPFAFQLEQAEPITRLDTFYHGKFVHIDDKHIYQELGQNNVVKHQRSVFTQNQLPELGKFGAIKYENGQAQLVSKQQNKKLTLSK